MSRGFRHTAFGEVVHAIPPAIRGILFACLGIWVLQLATTGSWPGLWLKLALVDHLLLEQGHLWQLVTYQFLHSPSNFAHVLFNMYALWLFGCDLERRWGPWGFVQFYLTCGVGAGLLHVLATRFLVPQASGVVVGASGAVFGVLVAYAMLWPRRRILLMFVFPVEVRHVVIILAAVTLLFAWRPDSGVANLAHLGGMLTGWLYLKHAWRLGQAGRVPGWIGGRWREWRRERRRRRMRLVERDFDAWLEERDDETRH